jgi:hypothetical protein
VKVCLAETRTICVGFPERCATSTLIHAAFAYSLYQLTKCGRLTTSRLSGDPTFCHFHVDWPFGTQGQLVNTATLW